MRIRSSLKDKFGGPLHFRVGRIAKVVMYFAEAEMIFFWFGLLYMGLGLFSTATEI